VHCAFQPQREPWSHPRRTLANNLSLPVLAIEGIGPEFSGDLETAGIFTVADLLRVDPSRVRAALSSRPTLSQVRSWYHMAAFLQIRSMTPQGRSPGAGGLATFADLRSRDLSRLTTLFAEAERDNVRRSGRAHHRSDDAGCRRHRVHRCPQRNGRGPGRRTDVRRDNSARKRGGPPAVRSTVHWARYPDGLGTPTLPWKASSASP
jgi:hypothetical protein